MNNEMYAALKKNGVDYGDFRNINLRADFHAKCRKTFQLYDQQYLTTVLSKEITDIKKHRRIGLCCALACFLPEYRHAFAREQVEYFLSSLYILTDKATPVFLQKSTFSAAYLISLFLILFQENSTDTWSDTFHLNNMIRGICLDHVSVWRDVSQNVFTFFCQHPTVRVDREFLCLMMDSGFCDGQVLYNALCNYSYWKITEHWEEPFFSNVMKMIFKIYVFLTLDQICVFQAKLQEESFVFRKTYSNALLYNYIYAVKTIPTKEIAMSFLSIDEETFDLLVNEYRTSGTSPTLFKMLSPETLQPWEQALNAFVFILN